MKINYLFLLIKVIRFINKLKRAVKIRALKTITYKHALMINDISYFYQ
jgi:hypothetical protein